MYGVVAPARVDSRKIITTLRFSAEPVARRFASGVASAGCSETPERFWRSETSGAVRITLTKESREKDLLAPVEPPPGSTEKEKSAYTASPTPTTRSQETPDPVPCVAPHPRKRPKSRVTSQGPKTA